MKQIEKLKIGDKLYGFCYPVTNTIVVQEEYIENINLKAGEIETDDGFYMEDDLGRVLFMTKEAAEMKAIEIEEMCREVLED